MKLIGLVGSAVQSGRTRKGVEVALAAAVEASSAVASDLIDLAAERVSVFDGRRCEQYPDSTSDVISRLSDGDAFIIASPIYRGTYSGALKNVLDHLPLEALEGKVVGLIATGASLHHYLSIDYQLRGVLAWFNAYLLPGSVYLDDSAFSKGELVDFGKKSALKELGNSLVSMATKLRGVAPMPSCVAREMMTVAAKKNDSTR